MSKLKNQNTYTLEEVRTIARNAMQTGREHALAQLADSTGHVSDDLQKSFKNNPGSVSERQEAKGMLRAQAWISATVEALQCQELSGADEIVEAIIADLGATDDNKRLKGAA